jgi:hypothetical protein
MCECVARSRLEHESVSQPKLPFRVTELVWQLEDACPQGGAVQTVHCEGASLLASGRACAMAGRSRIIALCAAKRSTVARRQQGAAYYGQLQSQEGGRAGPGR